MKSTNLWHKELRENFAEISNEVFEYIGIELNKMTKIEIDKEGDKLYICLPLANEFEYSIKDEIEFKRDVKILERIFGISIT